MSDKRELRAKFKALRSKLKSAEKDERIAELVLENFDFSGWFVYLSFGSEAGTQPLIARLKALKKQICAPVVEGEQMLSVPLSDKLKVGAFHISEPDGGEDMPCPAAVVPMLAFDSGGYRLGYGGGYYDRYFATHPDIFKLGIAYEGQFSAENFREEFDVPLDALVTEAQVRLFSERAKDVKCRS